VGRARMSRFQHTEWCKFHTPELRSITNAISAIWRCAAVQVSETLVCDVLFPILLFRCWLTPLPFVTLLHRGLGRALLQLRDHPDETHRPLVLNALLNSTRIDPQCEGTGTTSRRLAFLMAQNDLTVTGVAQATGLPEAHLEALLAGVGEGKLTLNQLRALAEHLHLKPSALL
jgi:DNA-binding Xre family transcriptional regulator